MAETPGVKFVDIPAQYAETEDQIISGITEMIHNSAFVGGLALADLEGREVSEERRAWIEAQLASRAKARKTGDYAKADAIRDELAAAGVEVDDTSAGSRWRLVERG